MARAAFCHILPDLLPLMSDRAVCAVIATGDPDASAVATAHFVARRPEHIQAMIQYAWAWALWTSLPLAERRRHYETWRIESVLRSPTHTYEDLVTQYTISPLHRRHYPLATASPLMCAMRRYHHLHCHDYARFLADWDSLSRLLVDTLIVSLSTTTSSPSSHDDIGEGGGGGSGSGGNGECDVTIEFPSMGRFTSLLHQSIMAQMGSTGSDGGGGYSGTHLLMTLMAK